MNIMKIMRLTLLLFFLLPQYGHADINRVFITGQDLLDYCEQSSNFCFGYVTAVVDDTGTIYGDKAGYCLPADINAETLQQSVINYMKNNLQILGLPGASVVVIALKNTYPCS